jgi:hypothetical protein
LPASRGADVVQTPGHPAGSQRLHAVVSNPSFARKSGHMEIGIVGILVVILLVVLIIYFIRRA